jgi:hypothetical protein
MTLAYTDYDAMFGKNLTVYSANMTNQPMTAPIPLSPAPAVVPNQQAEVLLLLDAVERAVDGLDLIVPGMFERIREALEQQAAPAPVAVPVAEDLQHLIRFMCGTWVAIDEWASMFSEAMDTYPMIQGTRNQMNLREIAAQSYDKRRVAFGVQLMLPHHAIPLPQAGEVQA